jgi:hypothetical protein
MQSAGKIHQGNGERKGILAFSRNNQGERSGIKAWQKMKVVNETVIAADKRSLLIIQNSGITISGVAILSTGETQSVKYEVKFKIDTENVL